MRIRIDLAYDGTDFHGWAVQPGLRTVQGELQAALATILRVESVSRGLRRPHRRRRARARPGGALRRRRSRPTPEPAGAPAQRHPARRRAGAPGGRGARRASTPASARCGAATPTGSPTPPAAVDPLTRGHVLAWPRPLDLDAMNEASALLVGRHDFASFCKQREGATTIRTARALSLGPRRDRRSWSAPCVADAFCHSMVRSLVGCLIADRRGPAAGRRGPARSCAPTARDPARDRRARARAHARGGRLPGRRRAGGAGRRRRERSGWPRCLSRTSEHYFSADPSVPFARETVHLRGVGPRADAGQRLRRLQPRATSTTRRRSSSARPSRRRRAGSSTSAAGTA